MPTDAQHESALRGAVKAHYADAEMEEEPTVNNIRIAAEKELGLASGFYKTDPKWKAKSKETIQDQFHKSEAEKDQIEAERQKALKRPSPKPTPSPQPRKKVKVASEDESTTLSEPPESEGEEAAVTKKPKKKPEKKSAKSVKPVKAKPKAVPKKSKKSATPISDEESEAADENDDEPEDDKPPLTKDDDDGNSSELSSVIDDPVLPRKSSKAKNGHSSKSKSSTKSKAPAESDPSIEEIKRLQGWLVKCGVRKVWGKELKPYETAKAKINHLKQMLADVGMTGRYSNEKAAGIKEARELAADIEAVQEGNERWGKTGDDEDEDGDGKEGRSAGGRRLVRGAKNYDFLDSDDGEETD